MHSIILGISGKKQSGKNTVALAVRDWFYTQDWDDGERSGDQVNGSFVLSFADPIKNFLVGTMGLKHEQCHGTDDQKNSPTNYLWDNLPFEIRVKNSVETHEFPSGEIQRLPRVGTITGREMMQVFGTDIMRHMFDEHIWVNALMRNVKQEMETRNLFLPIVADVRFVTEASAILNEPNGYMIRLTRGKTDDPHSSEHDLDTYDWSRYGDRVLTIDNVDLSIEEANLIAIEFVRRAMGIEEDQNDATISEVPSEKTE